MVESSGFSVSHFGSSAAQTSSGRQEEQSSSADLNPYISKKAQQNPDTWQTVQKLGLPMTNNQVQLPQIPLISQLSFDKQGEILTAGYTSGSIVLFQYRPEGGDRLQKQRDLAQDVEMADQSGPSARDQQLTLPSLEYLTDFMAFVPEFDYVRAYEIPAKVTSIEWLNRTSSQSTMSFVVANDKKIRLFKLRKEFIDYFKGGNLQDGDGHEDYNESSFVERYIQSNGQIVFPKTRAHAELQQQNLVTPNTMQDAASGTSADRHQNSGSVRLRQLRNIDRSALVHSPVELRESFTDVHQHHIHSVSQSADNECIISSDDTTVVMWNIERSAQPDQNRDGSISDCSNCYYKLIDKAPKKIFELSEVITHAQFHPTEPSQFLLASSKGYVEIYDLRQGTKMKAAVKCVIKDNESQSNTFGEIANSITSARFIENLGPPLLASRDYLNVKMWDLRKPQHFVQNLRVQHSLHSDVQLQQAYDSQNIFDRFDLQVPSQRAQQNSENSDHINILTGGYNNTMHVIQKDYFNCQSTYLDMNSEMGADNSKLEYYNMQDMKGITNPLEVKAAELYRSDETRYHNFSNQIFDFNSKVLFTQYHPLDEQTVVGSNQTSICLFSQGKLRDHDDVDFSMKVAQGHV